GLFKLFKFTPQKQSSFPPLTRPRPTRSPPSNPRSDFPAQRPPQQSHRHSSHRPLPLELKCRLLSPNDLTFSFLLKACCRDGVSVDCVKQLHPHVLKSGLICDSFTCIRNAGIWTQREKFLTKTLLGALCACSHSGLLDKGRQIFNEMIRKNYSITPKLEHYACYVDLLARSGFIEEALGVVESMPFEPNNFVWGALLSGCVLHNRLELARSVSNRLVMVDPENSAGYVMLSNSFAADSQWRDVLKLRGVMREKGVAKQPGRSWINVGGVVREFVAGYDEYCRMGRVHKLMESLLKEMRISSA
ncbi:pentatricopeptide repeat-containing protein at2g13600, partial [Phtheirospermum japonicum]